MRLRPAPHVHVDADDARELVVPAVAPKPALGLPVPAERPGLPRRPGERLRLRGVQLVVVDQDRVLEVRVPRVLEGLGVARVLGPPRREVTRVGRQGDAGRGGSRPGLVAEPRRRARGGDRAVDDPRRLVHELGREGRLHDRGAGRQGQLEVGAVGDVGESPPRPGRVGVGAGQGVNLGQVREGHVQSVEVDAGGRPGGAGRVEDAHPQSAPGLGPDRVLQEVGLLRLPPVDGYGDRVVPHRVRDHARGPATVGRQHRERHAGAVVAVPAGVRRHGRGRASDEVVLPELDAPGGAPGDPRAYPGRPPREREDAHAGGVLGAVQVLRPAAPAERQQRPRVADAPAVVAHGDPPVGPIVRDGDRRRF